METGIPSVWECWWLEQQHQGSGTGTSRPIQAPMGLQTALHCASALPASPAYSCLLKQLGAHSHIPVRGEPFPPLRPAGLCLLPCCIPKRLPLSWEARESPPAACLLR